jgi:hypothetical protein
MAFYTGRSGSLSFGGKPVAKIRDWSLDTTVELLSTNTIDSAVNTFTPGVKGATGSATLMYYRLESGESASYTQFTALLSKIMKGGAITDSDAVTLDLNVGSTLGTDDIQFNAFITSASLGVSTGELTTVQIQFTMTGDFIDVIG